MNRVVSVAIAYPLHVDFGEEVRPVIEEIIGVQVTDEPRIKVVGSAYSCVFEVELPAGFDMREMLAQMDSRLPDVSVNVVASFREPIWAKRRVDILIAVASGVAVAAVIEMIRPFLAVEP